MSAPGSSSNNAEGIREADSSDSDAAVERHRAAAAAAGGGGSGGAALQQPASSRLLRAVFECHRGKKGKDSRQPADAKPIRSKKFDCPFQHLELKVDAARPDTVVITERQWALRP